MEEVKDEPSMTMRKTFDHANDRSKDKAHMGSPTLPPWPPLIGLKRFIDLFLYFWGKESY